jgi:hypothetical protein
MSKEMEIVVMNIEKGGWELQNAIPFEHCVG